MHYGNPPSNSPPPINFQKYLPSSFTNIFSGSNPFNGSNSGGGRDAQIMDTTAAVGGNGDGSDTNQYGDPQGTMYRGGSPDFYRTGVVNENGGGGFTPTPYRPQIGNGASVQDLHRDLYQSGNGELTSWPKDSTDAVGEKGGGVATTMAIPENGGGRAPQEQTNSPLGPKQEKRMEQVQQASASAGAKLETASNEQSTQMKHAPPKASIKQYKPKADGTGGLHTDKKWSQLSKSERKEVKAIHGDKAKDAFQKQRAKSMGYENEQAKKDDFAAKRKAVSSDATHADKRAAGMAPNQRRKAERRAKRAEAQKFKDDKVKKITGKS